MVNYMSEGKTTIQVSEATRDRLYKLKFRRTYDQFLNELCDLYEEQYNSGTSAGADQQV
jgi:hypothetical protein